MSDTSTQKKDSFPTLKLLIICLSIAIIVIDGTVLSVSIKEIVSSLGTDIKSIQWAQTSYSLVLAALTITGGKLGDIFGRKKMFILGAFIFGLGSLVTALSPNIGVLILGWSVIEGIGAALMTPAGAALIVDNFEPKQRGVAFGVYGATAGAAAAFGPIVGGLLTTYLSWRWAFGINIIVAAVLILGAVYKIQAREKDSLESNKIDWLGTILSATGLSALTYGVIESSSYGWLTTDQNWEIMGRSISTNGISISIISILTGVLLLGLFLTWESIYEKRGGNPMVSLKHFRNRGFTVGVAVVTALFAGFNGLVTYGLSIYYQSVLNYGAFQAGLGFLPFSIATLVAAPLSNRLAQRFGVKRLVIFGLILGLLSTIWLRLIIAPDSSIWILSVPLFMFGLGFGLFVSQLTNLILSSVSPKDSGEASGVYGTIREVGRTVGSALIGAIFIATFTSSFLTSVQNNNVIPNQAKTRIETLLEGADSTTLAFTDFNNSQDSAAECSNLPVQAQASCQQTQTKARQELTQIAKQSVTNGARDAITQTVYFQLIALVLTIFIPSQGQNRAGSAQ